VSDVQGPVHLVGIGGIHMSAIAQLLMEQGVSVSGSDLRASALTERLARQGARVSIGEHAAENVGSSALLVTTAAADDANPEIEEARRRGIEVLLRAEMVARLMAGKRVIAVSGSHGKTTSSSLIAFVLKEAGLSPMYLLGGHSPDLGGHAAWGGPLCVVEADEYRRAFHEYTPWLGIILNVEPDHLDYYGTAEAYHEAFAVFAAKVQPGGIVLACGDDAGARAALNAAGVQAERETYGIDGTGLLWRALDVELSPAGTSFVVQRNGTEIGALRAQLAGRHSVYNVLAATAACLHAGVDFAAIADTVARFSGASRRFERVGEAAGVLVMDDYAHHPSEVRAILKAARTRFPGRRIVAVHQPHTYSRIAYLWDDWTECWGDADELLIVETYAARETPDRGRAASDLTAAIHRPKAQYAPTFEEAADMVAASASRGDVVFTIGAGDVDEVGRLLLEKLR
jgi:UDP-N-acetylmuramate--alanine ligase